MNNENSAEKKSKAQENLKQFGKSLGIGIIEGGITAGIGYLLLRLNIYTMFCILLIWLVFGWFSSYIIKNKALEILTLVISGNAIAGLIYFLVGIEIWFLSLIIGLSIFFWMISFTTKILLYPAKKTQDEEQELKNNEN
jgi:hypothetical protein